MITNATLILSFKRGSGRHEAKDIVLQIFHPDVVHGPINKIARFAHVR